MTAFSALVGREVVRFVRQPSRLIGALATPLLFWLFIGAGVGRSFDLGGSVDFLRWFFPGTLVLIVFFTSIFSTISVIEDRREGFLQSVLVAPVSKLTVAGSKVAGGVLLSLLQVALFLLLAPLGGVPITAAGALQALVALGLLAVALTGVGFVVAWSMDSIQGFHAIMNVLLMPLWLLSGSAFPVGGAHDWLRVVMQANPLTYGVALVRKLLDPAAAAAGGTAWAPAPAVAWAVTLLFAGAALAAAAAITTRRGRVVSA
jgi:ABC-2 type transport system permease protein